jgi:hypothetical protein
VPLQLKDEVRRESNRVIAGVAIAISLSSTRLGADLGIGKFNNVVVHMGKARPFMLVAAFVLETFWTKIVHT